MLVVHLIESLEYPVLLACRYARSGVGYLKYQVVLGLGDLYSDVSAFRVFECVRKQVVEYDFEVLTVCIESLSLKI